MTAPVKVKACGHGGHRTMESFSDLPSQKGKYEFTKASRCKDCGADISHLFLVERWNTRSNEDRTRPRRKK